MIWLKQTKKLLMATKSGHLSLIKIKDNGELILDQNLPKILNRLTSLQVSHCESFIVGFR